MGRKKNNNQTKTKTKNCKARMTKRRTKEEYVEGKEYPIEVWTPPPQLDAYIPPQMLYETDAEKRMMPYQQPEWTDFDQQRYDSVNTPQEEKSGPNFKENFKRGSNYYNSVKNTISSHIPQIPRRTEKHNYLPNSRMTTKIYYNGEVIEVPIHMIPKKKSWFEKNGDKIINAAIAASIFGTMGYGGYTAYKKGDDILQWFKSKLDWAVKKAEEDKKDEKKDEKK